MKQLKQSLPTVILIGILSVSCTNQNASKATISNDHPKNLSEVIEHDNQETYDVTPTDYQFTKEASQPLLNTFKSSNDFELANNIHSFNTLNSGKEFSLITTLISILLTLSFCKMYFTNIDNENYWFESEMKRMKKTKKSSFTIKELSQTQYN